VRGIDGIVSPIDVTPTGTVLDVKEKLTDKTGVPANHIWLSYAGRVLNDGCPIEDCGFHECMFLQAHLRLTSSQPLSV
jgi:hypothetical protein